MKEKISIWKKLTVIQWLSIVYLVMTVVNAFLFRTTGIGSNLPTAAIVFFMGYGRFEESVFLVLSFLFVLASVVWLPILYVNLFRKKREALFCYAVLGDMILSLLLYTLVSHSWWKVMLSGAFCALLFHFKPQKRMKSMPNEQ